MMIKEMINMLSIVTSKDVDFLNSTKVKTNFGAVLNEINNKDIVVIRNGEPEAVIISYNDYKKVEELIERLEDIELSLIAEKRINTKGKTYSFKEAVHETGDDYEVQD
jgi:prevent-host-death family protein